MNGNNTFTAIAKDSYGRVDTNSVTVNLQVTNNYSYDLNGNLLGDSTRNFAYDDENQLTSVYVTNIWRNDFMYDGKLRRKIEKDYIWNSSSWTQTNEIHFIYDGNVVIQERDANNNPLVIYTRSGSSLLARTDNGQEIPGSPITAYYHMDGNANVTCLIYANQLIAAKYLYDPYGNTLSLSGPLANLNSYRFASKEWNNSAGIYYFGRRYYDPMLQRWLNRDPIGEEGGINLYAYVANNPINLIDPLGLIPCWLQNLLNELNNLENNLGDAVFGPDAGYNPLYDPNNPSNLLIPLSPDYIAPVNFNFQPPLSPIQAAMILGLYHNIGSTRDPIEFPQAPEELNFNQISDVQLSQIEIQTPIPAAGPPGPAIRIPSPSVRVPTPSAPSLQYLNRAQVEQILGFRNVGGIETSGEIDMGLPMSDETPLPFDEIFIP